MEKTSPRKIKFLVEILTEMYSYKSVTVTYFGSNESNFDLHLVITFQCLIFSYP